jgi:hypothetical protein
VQAGDPGTWVVEVSGEGPADPQFFEPDEVIRDAERHISGAMVTRRLSRPD